MLKTSFGSCIGNKFNADGSVRFFPGNTIICILDHESEVFRRVKDARNKLEMSSAGGCFTYLPDESLHMTAIEGVCDQVRKKELWTSKLPLDCPLIEVDNFFEKEFKKLPKLGKVSMTFDKLRIDGGINIKLFPSSENDEKTIRSWRDIVGQALGLNFPGHLEYIFHIGLAYGIRQPTEKECDAIEEIARLFEKEYTEKSFSFLVPEPSMTFFDNMFFFNKNRIPREAR